MAVEKGALKALGITYLIVAVFTVPGFRSGGRGNLTAFDWIKEHTIWGSPVQYVPEEDYARELETPQEAADGIKALPRFASQRSA